MTKDDTKTVYKNFKNISAVKYYCDRFDISYILFIP